MERADETKEHLEFEPNFVLHTCWSRCSIHPYHFTFPLLTLLFAYISILWLFDADIGFFLFFPSSLSSQLLHSRKPDLGMFWGTTHHTVTDRTKRITDRENSGNGRINLQLPAQCMSDSCSTQTCITDLLSSHYYQYTSAFRDISARDVDIYLSLNTVKSIANAVVTMPELPPRYSPCSA